MKSIRIPVLALFLACPASLAAPAASATDAYTEAFDRLCEKVKGCARAEMDASGDMTDDMRAMIDQQLEVMCQGIESSYGAAAAYPDLVSMAAGCMDSMAALSCGELMNGGDDPTPQCAALQERTDQLGN